MGTACAGALTLQGVIEVAAVGQAGEMVLPDQKRELRRDLFQARGFQLQRLIDQLALMDVFKRAVPAENGSVFPVARKGPAPHPATK